MKMSSTFFCLIVCATLPSAFGWGGIGHSIVAHLAQRQLNDVASAWTRFLIPWHWNGNLSSMASWADSILYADSNPHGYPNWQWSRPLHYINVPDWNCSYQIDRDCVDDVCIDGAIRNYTRRLANDFNEIQRQEALYFLIHYVGDIHQPMHCGFAGDRGGNSVRGYFMNGTFQTNLHSLWDSGIIAYRMQRSFNSSSTRYHEHIYQLMLRQNSTIDDNDIDQWIRENLDVVCKQIYFDDDNRVLNSSIPFHLGESYYERSWPIIEQRLAHGGRRLGALLNRLANNQSLDTTTTSSLPSSTTTTTPQPAGTTTTPSLPAGTTKTGVSIFLVFLGIILGGLVSYQ